MPGRGDPTGFVPAAGRALDTRRCVRLCTQSLARAGCRRRLRRRSRTRADRGMYQRAAGTPATATNTRSWRAIDGDSAVLEVIDRGTGFDAAALARAASGDDAAPDAETGARAADHAGGDGLGRVRLPPGRCPDGGPARERTPLAGGRGRPAARRRGSARADSWTSSRRLHRGGRAGGAAAGAEPVDSPA